VITKSKIFLVLSPNSESEIHGLCDASIEEYGACVYVVCNGRSQLICPKSLCPSWNLVGLKFSLGSSQKWLGQMHLKDCWSDSAVALSWIRDEPSRFNVFVPTPVTAIQEKNESVEWRYVPTSLNPADILSL